MSQRQTQYSIFAELSMLSGVHLWDYQHGILSPLRLSAIPDPQTSCSDFTKLEDNNVLVVGMAITWRSAFYGQPSNEIAAHDEPSVDAKHNQIDQGTRYLHRDMNKL